MKKILCLFFLLAVPLTGFSHPVDDIGYDRSGFTKDILDGVKNVTSELNKKFPASYFPETQKVGIEIATRLVSSNIYRRGNMGAPRITLRIVNNRAVNAMAAGDGRIYIFAGIMDVLKSDDELAAVVAHELAHVTRAHQERIVEFLASRGVNLGQGKSTMGGRVDFFSLLKAMLELPKFKRQMEQEADEVGLQLLIEAGYPAAAMARAFTSLLTYSEMMKAKKAAEAIKAGKGAPPKKKGIFGGDWMQDIMKKIFEDHPPLSERIGGVYKEAHLHHYSLQDNGSLATKLYQVARNEVRRYFGAKEIPIKPNPFPIP